MRWAILGAALAAMAACGPLNEGNVAKGALAVVQSRVAGLTGAGGPAQPAAPVLTRAQADANPGAFLLVTAYGGASQAAMVPASGIGNRVTWLSADNVSVTLEDGILVATRGFPRDLMAADLRGVRQAIAAGQGQAQRVQEIITDLDQIRTEVLQCSIATTGQEVVTILGRSAQTRRVEEQCKGNSTAFSNTYWLTSGGQIVQSNQAVAPGTGFLLLQRP